ncbi:hypothetical protein JCM16303_006970 [Sporobolomyces ruberrimus]
MLSNFTLPLVGLAFEPQSSHKPCSSRSIEKRSSRSQSPSRTTESPARPSGLAWFPVEPLSNNSPASSSSAVPFASRRSILNPETPAFEPLSPPEDSLAKSIHTSPNRRRTLELPPSPPDSPPTSSSEPLLTFARPKSKASRGRAPTRSATESRARSATSTRRSRTTSTPYRSPAVAVYVNDTQSTIPEEEEEENYDETAFVSEDDERFLSLPLLRLRHRLSTSLTLSTYPAPEDKVSALTSLPSERSTSPTQRRRRSFPPGTVWAEQSHYRLYALQKSKADRTSGVGYWKRWEGVDLE